VTGALKALLGLAALVPAAAAAVQERQEVINVYVVAPGAPMAARAVPRGRPFYQQPMAVESNLRRGYGIQFDLTPEQLDALRDRHDMDDDQPFILAEWIAPGPTIDAPSRHLGFLHCSLPLRTFVGVVSACLRDADEDGRLDSVVTFASSRFPPEGLQFAPIEPVGYRYVPQDAPPTRSGAQWGGPALGISYSFERDSGRLRFVVSPFDIIAPSDGAPRVEVDPAHLPATVALAGAELTVLAWDGRRATVRVDRPFPAMPVRIHWDSRDPQGGWRVEYFDLPLPGSARAASGP
jgi:hypothetical protein